MGRHDAGSDGLTEGFLAGTLVVDDVLMGPGLLRPIAILPRVRSLFLVAELKKQSLRGKASPYA